MDAPLDLTEATRAQLVQADPDRVRAAQLAAPDDRRALMAVYAFHAELAKVPELVSQPLLGRIRYQWWRDAVEEMFSGGAVRRHEVASPLARVVEARGVARFWLDRLIDGRERDLDPRPFADIAAARDYARATSGALVQLAVAALGGEPDDAALAAGEAWGLTGLARGYRFYRHSMLQHMDPADMLDAAMEAHARARAAPVPAATLPALAYASFVPGYVRRMRKRGFDFKRDAVDYGALAKQARLMRTAATGRL